MKNTRNTVLLLGQGVSMLGSSMHAFGIGIYMLSVKGSAMGFGRSLALVLLGRAIFSYFAEDIVKKVDNKKFIILMDMISGGIVLWLLLMSMVDELRSVYIIITTFTLSSCNTLFSSAMKKSVPRIVEQEAARSINLWMQRIGSITAIVAPFLGGILFYVAGIQIFLLFNGVSFILSALLETLIVFKEEPQKEEQVVHSRKKEEFRQGYERLRNNTLLVKIICTTIIFNMCIAVSAVVGIPYSLICIRNYTAYEYGAVMMAFPLGVFIGGGIVMHFRNVVASRLRITGLVRCCYLAMGMLGGLYYFWESTSNSIVYTIGVVMLYLVIGIVNRIIELPMYRLIEKQIDQEAYLEVKRLVDSIRMLASATFVFIGGIIVDTYSILYITLICSVLLVILAAIFNRQVNKVKFVGEGTPVQGMMKTY